MAAANGSGSLLEAMLAVQSKAPTLAKDRTVTVKTKSGGEYSYSYTPLDSIVEKIGPLLTENKLVWSAQPSFSESGEPTLKYTLAHAPSKESIDGEMRLVIEDDRKEDVQALGSAITYARRYALSAVLNIVADADDDGAGAGGGRGSAERVCPTCGADAIIKGKQEYGGGWVCFKKKGGCGAKFEYDPAQGEPPVDRVKRLVRKHNVKAGELRELVRGLGVEAPDGGNVVGLVESLEPAKAQALADFIEGNPIPEPGASDLDNDASGFKHPEPSEEDRRLLEGSAPS